MTQKNNWKAYKEVIDSHHIDCLYHFTDRENLESIIQNSKASFVHRLRRKRNNHSQTRRQQHLAQPGLARQLGTLRESEFR